jgi:hypothetical protein
MAGREIMRIKAEAIAGTRDNVLEDAYRLAVKTGAQVEFIFNRDTVEVDASSDGRAVAHFMNKSMAVTATFLRDAGAWTESARFRIHQECRRCSVTGSVHEMNANDPAMPEWLGIGAISKAALHATLASGLVHKFWFNGVWVTVELDDMNKRAAGETVEGKQ